MISYLYPALSQIIRPTIPEKLSSAEYKVLCKGRRKIPRKFTHGLAKNAISNIASFRAASRIHEVVVQPQPRVVTIGSFLVYVSELAIFYGQLYCHECRASLLQGILTWKRDYATFAECIQDGLDIRQVEDAL